MEGVLLSSLSGPGGRRRRLVCVVDWNERAVMEIMRSIGQLHTEQRLCKFSMTVCIDAYPNVQLIIRLRKAFL